MTVYLLAVEGQQPSINEQ